VKNSLNSNIEHSEKSLPEDLTISLRQFESEEFAKNFGETCIYILSELSKRFNLSNLDGVTIAYDYSSEVAAIDRGSNGFGELKPSTGDVEGIAMAPAVMRDGKIKSHLILNANYLVPMLDFNGKHVEKGINVIAHECAHVESNHAFYDCFPEYSYGKIIHSVTEYLRILAGQASWDEYFATKLSATIGDSDPKAFQETFLRVLDTSEKSIYSVLIDYQHHHDVTKGIEEVGNAVIELMKFASYMIGDCIGRKENPSEIPNVKAALNKSWFSPYFFELVNSLNALDEDYPNWPSFEPFERVMRLYDSVLAHYGVVVESSDSDSPYVHFYKMPFYDDYL